MFELNVMLNKNTTPGLKMFTVVMRGYEPWETRIAAGTVEGALQSLFASTNNEQSRILDGYRERSLSVGDVVRVKKARRHAWDSPKPQYFYCEETGWREIAQLLGEFLWQYADRPAASRCEACGSVL